MEVNGHWDQHPLFTLVHHHHTEKRTMVYTFTVYTATHTMLYKDNPVSHHAEYRSIPM